MVGAAGSRTGIDPPDRMVAQAITGGADAASCSVHERDGEWGYIPREGQDAMAKVAFRLAGDAEARVRTLPLTWVLMLAAKNATIEEVSAPDVEAWTWTAAAFVVAERTLPAGLILPQPLRRRWLWLLAAHDDRGMSGALHSENTSLSRYGALGGVLAGQVTRTTIPGARGRLNRTKRILDTDEFRSVIASTVAEYFSMPAALVGADGGGALLAYDISTYDPVVRTWQTYASAPPESVGTSSSKRRAALSDRSLHALELEVFGARPDAKKSMAQLISLDTQAGVSESGDRPTIGSTVVGPDDTARTVEQRLELGELVAQSSLSKGERAVISLRAQDRTEAEIAAILDLKISTVDTQLRRARDKLSEAANE